MTAKEYLEQVKIQDMKVRMMRTKLSMLKEALGLKSVTYENSGAALSNSKTDKIAEAIGKIIDYENDLKEQEALLTILRFDIEQIIQKLENKNEREVLERYYLLFQSIKEIRLDLNYSESRIYTIRREAFAKIDKILKDSSK
jgi:DNA-directed RNA polymerase specialized sigma subunit